MIPRTRRSLTLGAASVIAATTMLAGTAIAQDEVPQGGTVVVGEWQAATQLNTFMSNALRDQEAAWIISRPLVIVDDQGNLMVDDPAVREGRVPGRAEEEIPELHEVDCPEELRERIEALMGRYPDRRSASIPCRWRGSRRRA